jgi:hypothetical protein
MLQTLNPRCDCLLDPGLAREGVMPRPVGGSSSRCGLVFRHAVVEVMPVGGLAQSFSRELNASTNREGARWRTRSSWPTSSAVPPK